MDNGKEGHGKTSDPHDHSNRNKVTPAIADDAFLGEEDEDYNELYGNIYIGPGSLQPLPTNKDSGVKNNEVERKKPPLQPRPQPLLSVQNAGEVSLPGTRGYTYFFLGDLHWWTTDEEVEYELCKYGKVREVRFFLYHDCGKSQGYCLVEFYDPLAAAACMKGLIGHEFNGRPCVVSLSRATFLAMIQPDADNQGKKDNEEVEVTTPGDDNGGRGYGRGNWGRGNNLGMENRGYGNPMRNRGGGMGGRSNMMDGPVGRMGGAAPRMLLHPRIGPMGGYSGFHRGPIPPFSGVLPSYPGVGLHGVAPYVDHAFYGRGVPMHGMGMIPPSVMGGPNMGMWRGPEMGRWGGDEHGGGKAAGANYGEEAASDHWHDEVDRDRGDSPNATREKDRGSEQTFMDNRVHEIDRYVPSENDSEHDDDDRDRERGGGRDRPREEQSRKYSHNGKRRQFNL